MFIRGFVPWRLFREFLVAKGLKILMTDGQPGRIISADFRAASSALGSGEFEVELASAPPGDGGVGGKAGVAEDG